jgi:hypothetical protein
MIEKETKNYSEADNAVRIDELYQALIERYKDYSKEFSSIYFNEKILVSLIYTGVGFLYLGLTVFCFWKSTIIGVSIILSPIVLYLLRFVIIKAISKGYNRDITEEL